MASSLEQSSWYESTRQRLLSQQAENSRQSRKDWRHGPSGATYEELRHFLQTLQRHKETARDAAGPAALLDARPEPAESGEHRSSSAASSNEANGTASNAAEALPGETAPSQVSSAPQILPTSSNAASISAPPVAVGASPAVESDSRPDYPKPAVPPGLASESERAAAEPTCSAASADEASATTRASPSLSSSDPGPVQGSPALDSLGETDLSEREGGTPPAAEPHEQSLNADPPSTEAARESSEVSAPASPVQRQPGESGPAPPAAQAAEAELSEEAVPPGFTSSVGSVRPQDAQRVDFRATTVAGAPGEEPEAGRRDSHAEKEHGGLVHMAAVFEDCRAAVTRVRFSRHRPEMFAYAAADGTLRICHTGPCQGPRGAGAAVGASGSSRSPLKKAKEATGSGAGSSPSKARSLSRTTSGAAGTPAHASGGRSSGGGGSGGAGAKGSPTAGGAGAGSTSQARSPLQGSGPSTSSTPPSPSLSTPSASPAASAPSGRDQAPPAQSTPTADASRRPRRASKGPQTPRVMHELKGHTKEVTDFDWSSDDEYMASASLDKSLRVWEVSSGKCLRIIYTELQQLCIRFHPRNSNLLVAANSKPELTVLNFSTGRTVSCAPLTHRVLALEGDLTSVLFAGDSEGCVHSFTADERSGALARHHSNRGGVVHAAPTTSLHFRPTSALAKTPVLLACSADGSVRFFSVAVELQGYLFLKCSLQRSARGPNLAAAFAPSLVADGDTGEFIVTGNTDHHVCFFDFSKPRRLFVGQVTGHRGFVRDVSFNITGEWLVSGDANGVVILWSSHREEQGEEALQ